MVISESSLDTNSFFNRCRFIDRAGNMSDNFTELAVKQPTLTFNEQYLNPRFKDRTETPFTEITLADPLIDSTAPGFAGQPEFRGDYDHYLELILERLREVLLRLDPSEQYLFSHSSGSDSRIVSGVMAQLRREGLASFDNVLFYCWGSPEAEAFKGIMKAGGWDNYIVNDDSKPDAFDVGVPDFSVDGWNPYTSQMKFWGDLDPSEYIFLSGAEGETFMRPYEAWVHSRGFFVERGESIHRLCNIFKGGFFPLLSYDVLELTMAMPKAWRNVKDPRMGRDKVRTDLVERVGLLDIPVDQAYYNFNFTEARKRQMVELYQSSKFRRDHGVELDFDDLFQNANGWNSRCWSFAVTVYEQLM